MHPKQIDGHIPDKQDRYGDVELAPPQSEVFLKGIEPRLGDGVSVEVVSARKRVISCDGVAEGWGVPYR